MSRSRVRSSVAIGRAIAHLEPRKPKNWASRAEICSGWAQDFQEPGSMPSATATSVRFRAGQFIWMTLAPNRPPWHDHPFSIASGPADLPRLRLVIREVRRLHPHL